MEPAEILDTSDTGDEPECRPYSAQPDRLWARTGSPDDDYLRGEHAASQLLSGSYPRGVAIKRFASVGEGTENQLGLLARQIFISKRVRAVTSDLVSPELFQHVEESIESSRGILGLGDNWDDDGAKAVPRDTWERAAGFVRKVARDVYRRTRREVPAPKISPCVDGSVDIFWQNGQFKLLINIPDKAMPLEFYGETSSGSNLKGTIPSDERDLGMLCLLMDE
jgi:hypothetical protein